MSRSQSHEITRAGDDGGLVGKVQLVRRERGEEAADRIYDAICNRYGVECMLADARLGEP